MMREENFVPDDDFKSLLNYLASEVYRDTYHNTGDDYTYRDVGELFDGWKELKINGFGEVDLANGNIVNHELDIWTPLRFAGYSLPEAEEVFSRVSLNENTKEAVIAFRGTDVSLGYDSDHDDNIELFGFGLKTEQLYATFSMGDFYAELLEKEGYSITITGHSKDGGLGALYAASRGYDAYSINPAPAGLLLDDVISGLNVKLDDELFKEWPAILQSDKAIVDGTNVYVEVTNGDILNRTLLKAGYKYIGHNAGNPYVQDSEGNVFQVGDVDIFDMIGYHSPAFSLLLNEKPELIKISQSLPDFSKALFAKNTAELGARDLILELYYDSHTGGDITDTLIEDLTNLAAIKNSNVYYQLGTHLNAITKGVVAHARNQIDEKSENPLPLIQIDENGNAFIDLNALDNNGLGEDNPLQLLKKYDDGNGILDLGQLPEDVLPTSNSQNSGTYVTEDNVTVTTFTSDVTIFSTEIINEFRLALNETDLLSIINFGESSERMNAFQALYQLGHDEGIEGVNASGVKTFSLSMGTVFEQQISSIFETVIVAKDLEGMVLGAFTHNNLDDSLAQQTWELIAGDDGAGLIELNHINGALKTAVKSDLLEIKWPENFYLQSSGSYLGAKLGTHFADGDAYKDIVYSTLLQTIGEGFGTFADLYVNGNSPTVAKYFTANGVDWKILEDIPALKDVFFKNLNSKAVSALSNFVASEISGALNLEGETAGIFNATAGTITTGLVSETSSILFSNLPQGAYTGLLSGGLSFSDALPDHIAAPKGVVSVGDYVQTQLVGAIASYAAGRIASELVPAESKEAAILGSVGSSIGAAIATGQLLAQTAVGTIFKAIGAAFGGPVGIAVGAFIGQIAGTVLGNLFGGEDDPYAVATIVPNRGVNGYSIGRVGTDDGGSESVARSMAEAAYNGVNAIIAETHGNFRRSANFKVDVGYEGDSFFARIDGDRHNFDSAGEAIKYAALKLLQGADIVGGHAIVMRAWHNSEAQTLEQFQEDISVAEAFQTYLFNPTGVIALMMNDPESDAAQQWAVILERAAEMELHLPHEKDIDGGWGELLAARDDLNPEAIPEIQGDSLILTDPETGEQTLVEHVIGPGYEIVRIPGTDGNDVIEVLVDGEAISYVSTGPGDDTFVGHDGRDIFVGGDGDDTGSGGDGDDWLLGNGGNDTLYGEAGDDLLVGGAGNDTLEGGTGVDTIHGGSGDDIIMGNEQADYLYGGTGDDHIYGNEGRVDRIYGESGDDVLYDDGGDYLYGGKGDDTLHLNGGYAFFDREDGNDTVFLGSKGGVIRFNREIGANEIKFTKSGYDLIMSVRGEDQSITVQNAYTRSGTNKLSLQHWEETYRDDPYHYTNVKVNVSNQPDTIYHKYSRTHTPYEGSAEDKANLHIGARGNSNGGISDTMSVTLVTNHYEDYVGATHNVMAGTSGGDIFVDGSSNRANWVYGMSGNDSITLGGGNDVGAGGKGNDTITGKSGNDKLYGGEGNDKLTGGDGNDYISGGDGNDTIYTDQGRDVVNGGKGDDKLYANLGSNVIHGNEGDDFLSAGKSAGDNVFHGDEGDDELHGRNGADTLSGGDGNDIIFGNDNDDIISGGDGNDILVGGAGSDVINGGNGDDRYIYEHKDTYSDLSLNKNGLIDFGNVGIGRDAMSVTMTFDSATSSVNDILFQYSTSDQKHVLQLYSHPSQVYIKIDGSKYATGYKGFLESGWKTLTLTLDALTGDLALYDADNLVYSKTINPILGGIPDDGILIIGQNQTGFGVTENAYVFEGQINEFTVWDRAVSQEEIVTGLNRSDAIHNLDFENVQGNIIPNLSGNGDAQISGEFVWNDNSADMAARVLIDGYDIISDESGQDTILFGRGIKEGDLSFETELNVSNDLTIKAFGETIAIIKDQFVNNSIEVIKLYDGTVLHMDDIPMHYIGSNRVDSVDYTASGEGVVVNLMTGMGIGGTASGDTYSDIEQVTGSNHRDKFFGNDASNIFYGLSDNDVTYSGIGALFFDGGDGWDSVQYAKSSSGVTINLRSGVNQGDYAVGDVYQNVEGIFGSQFGDTFIGDDHNNFFNGWNGDDVFYASNGSDLFVGGNGADRFILQSNDDYDGVDRIRGFSTQHGDVLDISNLMQAYDPFFDDITDYVEITDDGTHSYLAIDHDGTLSAQSYTRMIKFDNVIGLDVKALELSELLVTGKGLVTSLSLDEIVNGTASNDTLKGSANHNQINGLEGNDRLYGYGGNDSLYGGDGDDRLYGHGGNDLLHGGDGNDVFYSHGGDDNYDGGDGVDIMNLGSDISAVMVDLSQNTIADGWGNQDSIYNIERVYGSKHNDLITGDDNDNEIRGQNGDDLLYSEGGNDRIYGGDGNDVVHGGLGNDFIRGDSGDDILYGGDGNDNIRGYNGNDTLYGGAGADRLEGHAGHDVYVFGAAEGDGNLNRILGFTSGEDTIRIEDIIEAYDPLNDDLSEFIKLTESSRHTFLSIDQDGNENEHGFEKVIRFDSTINQWDDAADMISKGDLEVV